MRRLTTRAVFGAAVILAAVVLLPCSRLYAQIGFEAYGAGTLPAGEFGKSGAEDGHAVGGGLAWGVCWGKTKSGGMRLNPALVVTFGYGESQFGNDVPVSVFLEEADVGQVQFATPESGIRMRGLRFGLRMIPWGERRIAPTFGGGFERLKIKVDSRTFFGPGPQPGPSEGEPILFHITNESGNILGAFVQGGITVRSNHAVVLFGDLVYHMLFSDGVSAITDVAYTTRRTAPARHSLHRETPKPAHLCRPIFPHTRQEGKIKSNFQWWEVRGGLVFLVGK